MREAIKEWFDNLDDHLRKEAKMAGILDHNPTIGQVREFFIHTALKKILPPGVIVGSGQVISSGSNKRSKQIDVIIFDSRCFRLSPNGTDNNALYPIEGVIATIEVKSNLDKAELWKALDNCLSVNELSCEVNQEDKQKLLAKCEPITKANSKNLDERFKEEFEFASSVVANEMLDWLVLPSTYIFAFDGYKTKRGYITISMNGLVKKPTRDTHFLLLNL